MMNKMINKKVLVRVALQLGNILDLLR